VKNNDERVEVDHTINLGNGIASLNLTLPLDTKVGETLEFIAITEDETQIDPFTNKFNITVLELAEKKSEGDGRRRQPPATEAGNSREHPSGLDLPNIIKVAKDPVEHQKCWEEMSPPFTEYSGLRIINAGSPDSAENGNGDKTIYDFYINIDNIYLKIELKRSSKQAEVTRSKYIYAQVLLGLALINYENQKTEENDDEEERIDKKVEDFSVAVAPVIIPIINDLGSLELEA
jgi:hypothetical protein